MTRHKREAFGVSQSPDDRNPYTPPTPARKGRRKPRWHPKPTRANVTRSNTIR